VVAPLGEASRGPSASPADGFQVAPLLGERGGLGQPPLQRNAAGAERADATSEVGHRTAPPGTEQGGGRVKPYPTVSVEPEPPATAAAGPDGTAAGPAASARDPIDAAAHGTPADASASLPTEGAAEAVPGWRRPGEVAPLAPLLGERPVVLASLLAVGAPAPAEVRPQAPGEPAVLPQPAAAPGRAGPGRLRPGSALAVTRAPRAGPLDDGPPGGHPHPTGVRLPGGPPAPPTRPVAQATGLVAQRAAPPAPAGAVTHPAALALASGLATPDGTGGLRFAPPGAGPTVQLAGVAGDLSERLSAAAGAAEQLDGAVAAPAAWLDGAAAGAGTLAGAASGVGSTAGPAGAAPRATAAAADLDDLARRLYDRLRSRLMAELRLDRERAGLVTDLRH